MPCEPVWYNKQLDEERVMVSRAFTSDIARQLDSVWTGVVSTVFVVLLRLLKATWRVDQDGKLKLDGLLMEDNPTIIVFWHGHMVPLLAVLDRYSASVLSSSGFRGTVIGRIVEAFGNFSLQIGHPNAHGSLQAVLGGQTGLLAIAVDGPLGPYHKVKRGAIILSATCDARIVPISVEVRPAVYLRRWDRMVLPLPFARVSVRAGRPLHFAKEDLKKTDCAGEIVRAALEELEDC